MRARNGRKRTQQIFTSGRLRREQDRAAAVVAVDAVAAIDVCFRGGSGHEWRRRECVFIYNSSIVFGFRVWVVFGWRRGTFQPPRDHFFNVFNVQAWGENHEIPNNSFNKTTLLKFHVFFIWSNNAGEGVSKCWLYGYGRHYVQPTRSHEKIKSTTQFEKRQRGLAQSSVN